MLKVQPDSSTDSIAAQGSSAAKVLADYGAMLERASIASTLPVTPAKAGVQESDASELQKKEVDSRLRGNDGKQGAIPTAPREIGGRIGPEPTRFGDWEKSGRCIDF